MIFYVTVLKCNKNSFIGLDTVKFTSLFYELLNPPVFLTVCTSSEREKKVKRSRNFISRKTNCDSLFLDNFSAEILMEKLLFLSAITTMPFIKKEFQVGHNIHWYSKQEKHI